MASITKAMIKATPLLFVILFACKKKDKDDDTPPPPPPPVIVYNFDMDVKNSASNILHGKFEGASYSSLFFYKDSLGNVGSSLNFNGNYYVKVTDSDILDFPGSQFTIAAWILPTKTSAVYVVNKSANVGSGGPYSLDIYNGVVRGFVRTNTDEFFMTEGTTPIVKDAWQHIAVSFTGTKISVYYNGKPEGSKAVDRPIQITTGDVGVGASPYHFPSVAFQGKLDNVRFYDKGLTDEQILDLYKHYKL